MKKISIFISLIIFHVFLLIKSEKNNTNIVSLKFKTYYPYTNNSNVNPNAFEAADYYENIHESKIYLEVGVGNESNFETNTNQTLNVIVDLKETIFSTTDLYFEKNTVENNKILCNYNTSKSTTLYNSDDYIKMYGIETLFSYAKESFKIFTDLSLTKYEIMKLNFLNTINHNKSNICGNIGLTYLHQESHSYNFIAQLHSRFDLSEYSVIFNYSSKNSDEGLFILGNMPHVYLSNKYHIDNLVSIYSTSIKEPTLLIDELKIKGYDNENYEEQLKVKISPDIEGIEFPEFYFNIIEELFFQNYYNKEICSVKVCKRLYRVIQCDSSKGQFGTKDIKAFPKITFYKNNNFNISFTGEELFYYKNNKYFFKIVENVLEKDFVFGRILFKKYITVLNPDKKQISLYINNIDENINPENDQNNSYIKYILITIGCILCIAVIFLLGIHFGREFFKKRAKRACELDDDFEYQSTKEDNEASLFS